MTAAPRRYPDAPREDHTEERHGLPVADPYRWLEDPADPRTVRWTGQQEDLYRAERAGRPDADRWCERVAAFGALDRVLTPKVRGSRVFVPRLRAGQEHPVLFVRDGDDIADDADGRTAGIERPLLDPNAWDATGRTTLEAWQPSPAGDRLAYQVSRDGTEDTLLYVLDVATGRILDGPVDRIRGRTVGWLPDGERLYYIRCLPPEAGQPPRYHRRVWLHKVGSAPDADAMVFGEGRGKAQFYSVSVTADGRWLTVTASEGTAPATEVFLADLGASAPDRPDLRPMRQPAQNAQAAQTRSRLHVANHTGPDDPVWLRTDHDAPRGRVVATTPARADAWRTVVPERPDAVLTDFVALTGPDPTRPVGLAAWLRHAVAELTVHDLRDGRQTGVVPLPGVGTIGDLSVRAEGGSEAWFAYTDFATPPQIMRYDARDDRLALWARGAAGAIGAVSTNARQVEFPSRDGTIVRMFVVAPTDRPDRPRPTILFGYGGFGTSVSSKYASEVMAWVQAGGVFAAACIRGGGEEGEAWHRAGRAALKQNSFDDFAAAADHLVQAGWTTPGQLGVMGISNGGLLIGAAVTQFPEKFAAAVCMAPLLDMARFELSGLGPSWVPEYGSAADPDQFRTLMSYSPYHRVQDGVDYPAVLFTAADGDTRVDPLHARKMCAALQHASAGTRPVLFLLERGVGHGSRGASRRAELYGEALAFLAAELGLDAK